MYDLHIVGIAPRRRDPSILLIVYFLTVLSSGVQAMLAADFLDRLDGHQSAAYLDGAVETLAYGLAAAGDNKKATCVLDWYYRGQGPARSSAR